MADFKTILIVILVGYMVFWFMNPEKGKDFLAEGVDKAQSLISQGFGKIGNSTTCGTTYDPVCADGVDYGNLCMAQEAGNNNVTLGVC